MADLEKTIADAADKPKATTTDGVSVTGHSLPELIQADRYLAEQQAAKAGSRGLRVSKLVPPGTV